MIIVSNFRRSGKLQRDKYCTFLELECVPSIYRFFRIFCNITVN